MSQLPTACIIGAGSSGIAAVKVLHQHGFAFDCFERSDRVGGLWVYGNKNGVSSAYQSLHINTSNVRMAYSDFPMPEDFPDFPHHSHLARYFDDYVTHFGVKDKITFETAVERAERDDRGVWHVTLDTGETREYDALLVANGHHWNPRWPEPAFPGSEDFQGVQMHSHDYKGDDPELFRGKRVVVLGMGNSAMDIAVDASYAGEKVFLSARRGAWIVPKYLFGMPMDQIGGSEKVPFAVRRALFQTMLKVAVGDVTKYGLPKPDHRFGDAHPTISADVINRIAHGEITPKPNIAALEGDSVRFSDGSVEKVDVVVYCTGYKVTFPFFDEDFISAPDNDLPLFRRVFHPAVDNVFFIGLLQPLGAIMPLAEMQSEWVADYLKGAYALPAEAELRADMARERDAMFNRYVKSKRHTMQVDYDDYVAALGKERRAGAQRAWERGYAPPVPAQAREGAAA
jgi:dimethylaniline monooxygenase (N-oxide forming)